MLDIQDASIRTAGAYLCINGLYVFAIGNQLHNGSIPVFRLGGHRGEFETGWQCAMREVYEETNLQVKLLLPQTTYLADGDHIENELEEIPWQYKINQEPIPLLVVAYRRVDDVSLSLMYLAHAEQLPTPSSEITGLLLLAHKDIYELCQKSLTLEQYLRQGGKAILKDEFDPRLTLEPFAQLHLLSRILGMPAENKCA